MMTDIPLNIKIGQYFSLAEMCASDTAKTEGKDNQPSVEVAVNLTLLCTKVLDPLCKAMGPVTVRSAYRCGDSDAYHARGQAADIDINGDTQYGKIIYDYLKHDLQCKDVKWEYGESGDMWVHVAYVPQE